MGQLLNTEVALGERDELTHGLPLPSRENSALLMAWVSMFHKRRFASGRPPDDSSKRTSVIIMTNQRFNFEKIGVG